MDAFTPFYALTLRYTETAHIMRIKITTPIELSGNNSTPIAALERAIAGGLRGSIAQPRNNCRCLHCGVVAQHSFARVEGMAQGGEYRSFLSQRNGNLYAALCSSCNGETLILNKSVIFPKAIDAPAPSPDMPDIVLTDYNEAASILFASPRGAAALLRLAVQKLLPLIGATNPTIDGGIAELVEKRRITNDVKEALDGVRICGNEAVHPGELNLDDDVKTVTALFSLINYIVEVTLTADQRLASVKAKIPAKKAQGILDRDRGIARRQAEAEAQPND